MKKVEQRYIALIIISIGWLLIYIGRLTVPTLLVQIEHDLNVTDAQAGIAMTAMWFIYGAMQFPSGAISDSIGRKKIIIISLGGFMIANFLIGATFDYFMMFFTFVMLGFTSGMYLSPSLTMISEIFGPNKGKAFGVRSSISSLAGLVPIALPTIAFIYGWRSIFLTYGILSLLIAFLFYQFVKESLNSPKKKPMTSSLKTGLKSLTETNTYFMFIINLIISLTWIGLISWFPTYIQKSKNLNVGTAGLLFSIVLLGAILIKPILGHLSDKINKLWIMMFITILASISLYLLTITYSIIKLAIIAFLLSQTSAFYPVRTSYLMDLWYSETAGSKLGIFRSGIILLSSPISAIIGGLSEIYGFDIAILIIAGALVFASFLLALRIFLNKWRLEDKCFKTG